MSKKPKAKAAKEESRKRTEKKSKKAAKVAVSETRVHPVRGLRDDVDRLFENFEQSLGHWPSRWRSLDFEPLLEPFRRLEPVGLGEKFTADLAENDNEFRVDAELPGLAEEDIEVTYSDGVLTIKGEKEEQREEKEEDYHVSERRYGKFRRSFSLPQSVDADNIEANMKNGILTVILPKLPETKQKIRKVTVSKG